MTATMTDAGTAFRRAMEVFELRGRIRKTRTGVMVRCPGPNHEHGDRNPSLHVTAGRDGVLFHCFAGCAVEDVLAAMGWSTRDLFDTPRTEYVYGDRTVIRFYDDNGRKTFRQVGAPASGERTQLYNLAEVATADRVYLTEGERDADNLKKLRGVTTTTAPMGASNFRRVDPSPLYGKTVIAVRDADEAGEVWARQVEGSLGGMCNLEFRVAKVGEDVTDHLAAGLGIEELQRCEVPAAGTEESADDDQETAAAATFALKVAAEAENIRIHEAARERVAAEKRLAGQPFDAGTLAEVLARPAEPPARIEFLLPWLASLLIVAQRKTASRPCC